jgi:WD40 repeat protein
MINPRSVVTAVIVCFTGMGMAQTQLPAELKGHMALVYSLAFSPDGKTLASAGFDNVVKLWDFSAGGEEVRTLTGHAGPVYCVAFSPDGKILASSSADQTIRFWNPSDGKLIRELKGHTGIVDSVAFSPDGKFLASGSADKTVRLWNPADGKEVKNLGAHGNSVYCVTFSPDSKLLASAGADGLIKLWEVAGQKELKTLKGHDGMVTAVVFAPDNASIYSIGLLDRTLRQWNVASGMEMKKMGPTPDDLYGLAWSPDKKTLATSGYGGNVIVWDLASGKPASTRKLKFGAYCIIFTPDGKALVTGHDNHTCYVTPL